MDKITVVQFYRNEEDAKSLVEANYLFYKKLCRYAATVSLSGGMFLGAFEHFVFFFEEECGAGFVKNQSLPEWSLTAFVFTGQNVSILIHFYGKTPISVEIRSESSIVSVLNGDFFAKHS
jgi:hypothetical protein